MEIQERKKYIDILKGIGIFYVILGHVTHTSFLFRYIYSFHMPLFFFISGMLFVPSKHVSTSGYIKKKANSLLIPYIFFYLVSLLYWYFVEYRIFGRDGDTTFLNELYRIFHGTGSIVAGTLWFLPCLFCVEVLYCFMHDEHHKYAGGIYSVIVFIIGSVCIHYHFCPQILGLLQALVVMPVFAAGYYLRDKIDAIIASPLKMKVAIMCIALVVQYLLLDYSILNLAGFELSEFYIFFPLAFAGIAFYLMLSLIIRKNFYLEWIGKNSLFIFAFHGQIYRGIIIILSIFLSVSSSELREGYFSAVLITVITLFTMIPVTYIYNKWVAPLIMKKK